MQVHILLGIGDVKDPPPFEQQGVMSCVAASPNDPIFVNHHGKIDFILEEWLVQNKDNLVYPQDDRIRHGHRGSDYIVPFIPLYTHEDMFKTADNFGYEYPDTDDDEPTDEPNTDGTGGITTESGEPGLAVFNKAYNILICGLTLAVVVFVEVF